MNPTSKLRDTDNVEKAGLSFQRKAVQEFRFRQEQENLRASEKSAHLARSSGSASPPPPDTSSTSRHGISTLIDEDDDEAKSDKQPRPRKSL